MSLTPDEILKIASLSKLTLADQDLQRMAGELGKIISFVEKLGELNLTDVIATCHASEGANVFREDEAIESGILEKALKAAPAVEGTFFEVPKVI